MPALAKRSVGSSWGTTGLDFQKVCPYFSTNSEMNESRMRAAGQPLSLNAALNTRTNTHNTQTTQTNKKTQRGQNIDIGLGVVILIMVQEYIVIMMMVQE